MNICSVRGAITVENDDKNEILSATREMLEQIIDKNEIEIKDIVSVLFTTTADLRSVYPAVSARELGILNAGLMCMQEMHVENSLEKCIRVLITVQSKRKQHQMNSVYLKGATVLRPDLINKKKAIAIDGPSGSGKSTVAKVLAKQLGYIYVDTGAMYRTMALFFMRKGISLDDQQLIIGELDNVKMDIKYVEAQQRIFLDGEDVTEKIRTQEVATAASSKMAIINEVRKKLVEVQRKIADKHNIVMDGRDIGTDVLPNADLKIYLEASVDVRSRRRVKELETLGQSSDFHTVRKEIEERDEKDKTREHSPLRKAEDAIYLDCSDMNIEDVKNFILNALE